MPQGFSRGPGIEQEYNVSGVHVLLQVSHTHSLQVPRLQDLGCRVVVDTGIYRQLSFVVRGSCSNILKGVPHRLRFPLHMCFVFCRFLHSLRFRTRATVLSGEGKVLDLQLSLRRPRFDVLERCSENEHCSGRALCVRLHQRAFDT